MKYALFLAGALLAAATPAKAQVVLDLSKITCGQYLDADVDDQMFISSWLSGYFHSEANTPSVDLKATKKNHGVIKAHCAAAKKETLMNAVRKKLM